METIPKHQMILRELLILKLGTVKSVRTIESDFGGQSTAQSYILLYTN
jgi:hypothetical protein